MYSTEQITSVLYSVLSQLLLFKQKEIKYSPIITLTYDTNFTSAVDLLKPVGSR